MEETTTITLTSKSRRDKVRQLLREYAVSRDTAVRDTLVDLNKDLVKFIARRFATRGEPLEDIEQVGFLGLMYAIDRFDPTRDLEFSTFATPTITGEIRRYFRDKSWSVRVPRRLQEHYQMVTRADQDLRTTLSRAPTITEIGAKTGLTDDEVLEALEVAPAQHAVSLSSTPQHDDEGTAASLQDFLGSTDANLERVETFDILDRALKHLTPREKEILALRFVDQLPQAEVAKNLGISQMHVSRLQKAALEILKQQVDPEDIP